MGKRRHKSSSVEEVSPAIIKRKSSRLTRSKKLKAASRVPSPGLRNSPVSRQLEAGPSRTRNLQRRMARSPKVQNLLDYNTPVRPKHGRTSHLQLNSPHSESEPEIIWDDKSPNAVQPRKLGKGGKRNAVEDISDIINCVPEITTDNIDKKPSLLSLWMTRDSPSPKPTTKTNQETKRPSKKKSVGLKTKKSRLSALTHELEKVLSAIEPEKEDDETHNSEQPSHSIPTTVVSSITTSIKTRRTSPTLYTQTKPTQVDHTTKSIPLPELGHSPPLSDGNKKRDPSSSQKTQENSMGVEKDDESPPGSQTKWEAVGNESVNDLWGDDDLFEDDDLLMETIEVEIASSQMVQSTLKRKVKKRQSLKAKPSVKATMSTDITTGLVNNNQQTKLVKSTDTKHSNTLATACSTDTVPVQSQIKTVNSNSEKTLSSNYPVQVKLECCESRVNNKMPQSQKVFVPHTGNPKSSFQAYKSASASLKKVDLQTTCVPMSQETQKNAAKSMTYSLRSGPTMSTSTAKLQVTNAMSKLPNSAQSTTVIVSHSSTKQPLTKQSVTNNSTNRTLHQIMTSQTSSNRRQEDKNTSYKLACNSAIGSSSTVTLSASTVSVDSTGRTHSDPPNVTRIVYNAPVTSTVTNPSSFDLPISQSNNFVLFRSASQSKQALPQCTTRKSSAMNTEAAEPPKATFQNTGHVPTNDSNKLISSKVYVPFKKQDPLKNQNITEKIPSYDTFQVGTNGNASQLQNKFLPFSQQSCLATRRTSRNISQSKTTSKPCNSTKETRTSKSYVPYIKTGTQILPGTTQMQSLCNTLSASGVNNNSQRFVESSVSEKSATQTQTDGSCNIPPETSPHSADSVIAPCSIPSTTELVKPQMPITTNLLIKPDGNETSKTFVPFKKPQRQGMNQLKTPNSTNSSKYKPAITSSQITPKFQPVISKQNKQTFSSSQTGHTLSQKPSNNVSMTKSNVFVSHNSTSSVTQITKTSTDVHSSIRQSASVTSSKSNVCVRHSNSLSINEDKHFEEKHLQTNKISTNSKHSNNNTKKIIPQPTGSVKMTNPSKSDGHSLSVSMPCASFSDTSVLNSTGNRPVLQPPKELIEQFDDSLPDEILMSLVDMDGSWDEF